MAKRFGSRTVVIVGVSVVCVLAGGFYFAATHAVALGRMQQRAQVADALPRLDSLPTRRGTVLRYSETTVTPGASSAPPLVLLHGFGADVESWAEVVPDLARQRSLVVLELPGHGQARPSSPPLTFDDLVEGVDRGLESVRRPFVLLGNSLGGALAVHYASLHPGDVSRLILVNSAGGSWAALRRSELLPGNRVEMQTKLGILLGSHAPDLPGFILDQLLEINRDPRLVSLWEDCENGPFFDDELPGLGMPVDLVWGTPDPYFPKDDYAVRLRKEIKNSTFHELTGCAHVPQLACPEEFVRKVLELTG